ncbi:MAG: urease accessory protein UreD [Pseudomonadota bacterium]
MQRCDGGFEMAVAPRDGATRLVHLYQHDPCRLLFPEVDPGEAFTAVTLTTSGGLAGGDRIHCEVACQAGAAAVVTAQAAEKVYRSLGPEAEQRVSIAVEAGAWLEWLPQETILFDGARLRRTMALDVAPGARVMAGEMLVFGRAARGETFREGMLHHAISIRREGRLVWADALRLEGEIAVALRHPAGFAGAGAQATVLYIGEDAAALLEAARGLLAGSTARAGATRIGPVLIARLLGGDGQALRRDVARYWTGMRHLAAGLPVALPRFWYS